MNTSTWGKQTPENLIHFVGPKWTSIHPRTMPDGWYACGQNTMYVDKKTQFHCIPVPRYVLNHSRASTMEVVEKVLIWVRSPEGGALKGVSSWVFPNFRRMQEYWNLFLRKQLSFYFLGFFPFHQKEIFLWEHIKFGELPQHNALWYFCWGRSLKIHIEIKRELFR
jgi:hypothetical protein